MNASELFQAGNLQEAIGAQVQEVRAHPADHAKRLFLFELLCFAGDLDRARRQIEVIQHDDAELQGAVTLYRRLLDSEQARRGLFVEGLAPQFVGEPAEHMRLRLQAVNRLREGRPAEAAELLAQAAEATPAVSGQLNGQPFG
jgi:type VI secretion system protein ImpE